MPHDYPTAAQRVIDQIDGMLDRIIAERDEARQWARVMLTERNDWQIGEHLMAQARNDWRHEAERLCAERDEALAVCTELAEQVPTEPAG